MNIFKKGVEEYLLESGVSEKEIKGIKFKELKKDTIETLERVLRLLKEDKFDDIEDITDFSPAGDGMGCDNSYISFNGSDISERVDNLDNLK